MFAHNQPMMAASWCLMMNDPPDHAAEVHLVSELHPDLQ